MNDSLTYLFQLSAMRDVVAGNFKDIRITTDKGLLSLSETLLMCEKAYGKVECTEEVFATIKNHLLWMLDGKIKEANKSIREAL